MKRIYNGVIAAAIGAMFQATYSQQPQADPTTEEYLDKAIQNQADMIGLIVALDANSAAKDQKILDLLASDAPKLAKAKKVFEDSEAAENALRASVGGVPPVGGPPLLPSYTPMTAFDTAAAAYNGPETVKKDGIELPTAFTGTKVGELLYFSHSASDTVDTIGPTD